MTGAFWAILAGVGFGLFQTVNRKAVSGMDVYLATFVQLLVSTIILVAFSLLSEDIRLIWNSPVSTMVNFAAAGFFHFFIGWTFLNASQKRIGAARTSPLIGTTPLFATVIAAVILQEFPSYLALVGIGLIVLGAYVVSNRPGETGDSVNNSQAAPTGLSASWFGLSAAFCWAISPIFIRFGLEGLDSPLLGVTVGVAASTLGYGMILLWQRKRMITLPITSEAWFYKILAGILVGLSTWARWVALDLAPVAIVLAITMISIPLVILLSPLLSGKQLERVTPAIWAGAGLIIGGALMLIFLPQG